MPKATGAMTASRMAVTPPASCRRDSGGSQSLSTRAIESPTSTIAELSATPQNLQNVFSFSWTRSSPTATSPANTARMACATCARRPWRSCASPMARKPPMPMSGVGIPIGYANTVRFTTPQRTGT